MPTSDWRAEKSAAIIKQICRLLVRARAEKGGSLPDPVAVSRADLGAILIDATKLYCDANQERFPARENTWSPELPAYLLAQPERCEESLGIVADPEYRDPYYARSKGAGLIPDLRPGSSCVLELRHEDAEIARAQSLRELALKLSEAGLDPEVYLKVRNTLVQLSELPDPGEFLPLSPRWQLWTVMAADL